MAQGVRKFKPFLIIEEGKQNYTKEQLKEAGAEMEVIPNDNNIPNRLAVLPPIRDKRADVLIYLIGSDGFMDRISEAAAKRGFRGKFNRKFTSEDEWMEAVRLSFPEHKEGDGRKGFPITRQLEKIGDLEIADEEMSAVIIAAEELKDYQISPATSENIFHALVERTRLYLHDKSRAETVVHAFLQKKQNS